MTTLMINEIPFFAKDYPERATELNHLSLTFYCINCQRKAKTRYLTSDFGPFCDDCINELKKEWTEKTK
jgi:hypothetical protein